MNVSIRTLTVTKKFVVTAVTTMLVVLAYFKNLLSRLGSCLIPWMLGLVLVLRYLETMLSKSLGQEITAYQDMYQSSDTILKLELIGFELEPQHLAV